MVEPPGFLAIGSVAVMLKLALLLPADLSQPLQTMVTPRGIRKLLASSAGSVIVVPGSLPAGTRPKVFQVLRPRLGGSYIIVRMLRAGTGPGLGYMDYRFVLVFKSATALDQFLKLGADVSAQGNVTVKPSGSGESTDTMTSFTPGVSVYQLMDKGVNVQANWGGTKYFRDPDLN